MTYDEVKRELGTVAAYDVDNGPRGEKAREAIAIAIRAIEFCEKFPEMMGRFCDEDGEYSPKGSE